MVQNNLTSLANVKAWLSSQNANDDQVLLRLIASVSRAMLAYISRTSIFQQSYSEFYDGSNTNQIALKNYPVIAVASVVSNGISIPPATPASTTGTIAGNGFQLDSYSGFPPGMPQLINLRGGKFPLGQQNVAVSYTAGYVVQNEAQSVPATTPYQIQVNAPLGNWGADQGVTYANGTPLTPVSANPTVGQYAVGNGNYSFNAADANAGVLISYSYIPADLEDVCIEMVAEAYKYRSRIGEVSKTLGGQETMSYSQKDMPDRLKMMLKPYRSVWMG